MSDLSQPVAAQRSWLAHQRESTRPADLSVGVAASFTAQPLEPFLGAALLAADVAASFSFAEYNQIHEVCYDPTGLLGNLDVLIIVWRLEDLLGGPLERAVAGDAAALGELADAAAVLGSTIGKAASDAAFTFVVSVPPF